MRALTASRAVRYLAKPLAGPVLVAAAVALLRLFAPTPAYELAFTPVLFLLVAFAAFEGGLASGLGAAAVLSGYAILSYLDPGTNTPPADMLQLAAVGTAAPALALLVGALKHRASQLLVERAARAEAEAALTRRRMDASYRALVDHSPEGVAVHDGERVLYMNRAGAQILGLDDPKAAIGVRVGDFVLEVGPDGGPGEARSLRLRTRARGIVDAEFLELPVKFGERDAVQVVVRDVTDRRAAERRLAAEHTVSRILAEADSFDDAAPQILEALCSAFGWRKGGFWVPEPDASRLRLAGAWHAPERGLGRFFEISRSFAFAPGEDLPGKVWQRREPLWIQDLAQESGFQRARAAAAESLHTAFAFPIFAGDEFFAVMEFFDAESSGPQLELIEMLRSVGGEIGVFVRKTQAEAELRRSTGQLRAVLRNAAEGITAQDLQGTIVFANDAAAHACGFRDADELMRASPDEVLSRFEMLREDGSPLPADELPGRLALRGHESPRRTVRFRVRATGEERWALVRASPVFDDSGNAQLAINLFSDITEIMQYQAALEGSNARYEALTHELDQRAALLRLLADASRALSSSLHYESTLKVVADLAVEQLADGCIIYLGNAEDGYHGATTSHKDSARAALLERARTEYRPDMDDPTNLVGRILAVGQPHLIEEVPRQIIERLAAQPALQPFLAAARPRSALVVPLNARGRMLGAMALLCDADSERRLDERAVELAAELGTRVAVAVDNALLYREADEERRRAERAASHTARLQRVTAELSRAITPGEVARVILEEGFAALGAEAGSVHLLRRRAGGDQLELVRGMGYPERTLRRFGGVALDAPTLIAEAARTAEAIFIEDLISLLERYPAMFAESAEIPGERAWAALPLISHETVIGAIGLSFGRHIKFEAAERSFMRALARQCAQALERARLFEGERTARAAAEAAEQRLAFISEASGALAVSLDLHGVIQHLTRLVVSGLADVCQLQLLSEDGHRILHTAASSARPDDEERFRDILAESGSEADGPTAIESVLSTGRPLFLPAISRTDPALADVSPQHVRALLDLGIHSLIAVPLLARGRRLGAMLLLSYSARRHYGADDLALALELARRAALAVDNARLYANAQEANRAKADFLAVMSHELRTPLNAVIGYTDLLSTRVAGDITEPQERHLTRIKASALHLLELIEQVLTFARTEAGREEVRIGDVDLRSVAQEAVTLIEPQVMAKGLSLNIDVPNGPVVALSDSGKIRQIFANLLSNGVKFTASGEVGIRVHAPAGGWIVVEVYDTGIGIAAEHLHSVFEPFWQAEQGTTRHAGGTGLGLAVVQRLTRLLGGEVTVSSEPGRGSTFTLELPVNPALHARYPAGATLAAASPSS